MATIAASAGVGAAGLTFAAGTFGLGLIGMAIVAGAGIIDSQFLFPALLGDGKQQAKPTPLVGLPTTTSNPGTPRVWAMGRRVRVPMHVMFQSDKTRETTTGGGKGGVPNTVKRVFSDVAYSVNDRPTARVLQIAANGQLVWWSDKNLVRVTTDQVTSSIVSSRLLLTMGSAYDPDWSDFFAVGDAVLLTGYSADPNNAHLGTGVNAGLAWWKVYAVAGHGATPSVLTLIPLLGQNMGTLVSVTAGSSLFPGTVARLDQEFCDYDYTCPPAAIQGTISLNLSDEQKTRIVRTTNGQGGWVRITLTNFEYDSGGGWTTLAAGTTAEIARPAGSGTTWIIRSQGSAFPFGVGASVRPGTSSLAGIIRLTGSQTLPGMFAASPSLSFHTGEAGSNETGATAELRGQVEDDILARHETTGTIPGFRGLAYQVFDQWDLSTYFGNQLPPIVEGIIEPDAGMTVGVGIATVCDRAALDDVEIDVSGVNAEPLEGYWVQGAVPTTTALQPLLTAFQVLVQERGGKLAFFSMENADIVAIENGVAFSDFGTRSGAGTPNAGDKVRWTQADRGDLPTSIGIRHQDPDQQYAQGYQQFSQRQPTELPSTNEQLVDLSSLVLTRKQSRNLCGTVMRRTWVNANACEMQLPAAYLEVLENDLLTFTDDDGEDYTVRIIRREVGANFVINIVAVVEDVALAVRGSPIQSGGEVPTPIVQAVTPAARVMDIGPLTDEDSHEPGYYLAACSPQFGLWNGCSVYESRDGGTNWTHVASLTAECGMGTTTTSLATTATIGESTAGGPFWDAVNTVTVRLDNLGPTQFLLTLPEADVEAGWNWAHISDGTNHEIFGFRDVTDNGDGTYELGYLLRGLRGTYDSAQNDTKAAGSELTLLFTARQLGAIQFVPLNVGGLTLPVTVDLKFLAPGQSLADVDAVTVAVEGWNARPFPIREVTVDRGGSPFDVVFTTFPWSRRNYPVGATGAYGAGTTYPIDDQSFSFELRIYDPTGVTLQRTKSYTAAPGADITGVDLPYTAAEQTADGYTPSAVETFVIEPVQIGDYGDGQVVRQEIP